MSIKRLLWFSLLGTILWASLTGWEQSGYKKQPCPVSPALDHFLCLFDSPIAELELTTQADRFSSLIWQGNWAKFEAWNLETARVNTWMDFLFIGLYWATYVLFARTASGFLSRCAIAAISVAAVFDLAENYRLLQAIGYMTDAKPILHTPGFPSHIKWASFAIATFLLGLGMLRVKSVGAKIIAAYLLCSAPLIALGIFKPPFLGIALPLLFLALMIALFVYFPTRPFGWKELLVWVEFGYLIRFQLIAAILLSLVLPAAYFAAPEIFIGLYDALGFLSFIFVVWICLQLAMTIMITYRITQTYGPERFDGIRHLPRLPPATWGVTALFGSLAVPSILMAGCGTTELLWWQKLFGIAIAIVLAVCVIWFTAKVQAYLEGDAGNTARSIFPAFHWGSSSEVGFTVSGPLRTPKTNWVDRRIQKLLPSKLTAGLLRTRATESLSDGTLHSGHVLAAIAFVVELLIYLIVGIFTSPVMTDQPPAALFYALFLIGLFTWFFSGLAFFLDVVRVPVLTSCVAVSLLFGLLNTDHVYRVFKQKGQQAPFLPGDVVKAWERKRGNTTDAPIVLVATAGGGIRAAAWTTEVLTDLTDQCKSDPNPNKFASSLLLISSVSGGSDGAMYVAGSYDQTGNVPVGGLKSVRDASSRSSLSAVGWGLAYPDFLRTLPAIRIMTSWIFGKDVDRGWALERDWVQHWDGHGWTTPPTLGSWGDDVRQGIRPAVIFNSTAAESGQRFLLGSTLLPTAAAQDRSTQGSVQFWDDKNIDIPVSTAARLSATFPWVSPMPKASDGEKSFGPHLADGGYYDNSGILSAIEWLRGAEEAIKSHPVILVLIDSTPGEPKQDETWTWQRQITAPIQALLSVRTSSQQSRAGDELELAMAYLRTQHMDISSIHFNYPADPLAPLSWHLTALQQRRIGEAWSSPTPELQSAKDALTTALRCNAFAR